MDVASGEHNRTWLCPEGTDRARLLDMNRQMASSRRLSMGVLALVLVVSAPVYGWWTLAPLTLAAVLFAIGDHFTQRVRKPEYVMFAAWTGSEILIAASVAITGGATVPFMSWFAIPIVTLSARFSTRGIVVGVSIVVGLMAAVAFGFNTHEVIQLPALLLGPLATVIAVATLSSVLMRSDMEYRTVAMIDPLTGLLNRNALAGRVAELEQQADVIGEPVAVIIGDIDHFKDINDSLGHADGDTVLVEVAARLRAELRAFDFAYRLGGEEFLVLAPGADLHDAAELADQLRVAVQRRAVLGGRRVTMSFGVSASRVSESFAYSKVFAEADAALYEAKSAGRDRVCGGPPPQAEPARPAAWVHDRGTTKTIHETA